MKHIHFFLGLLLQLAATSCFAQSDSTRTTDSVPAIQWTPHLFLFNKPAPFSYLYGSRQHTGSRFDAANLKLPSDWLEESLLLVVDGRYLAKDPYPRNWSSELLYPYGPTNRYGNMYVKEDLILGALNFLLYQLIPPSKYFTIY